MLKFPTETVDEHITRIYAFGTELMYLIEGTNQSAGSTADPRSCGSCEWF